jgi:hypothetical protein
MGAFDSPELLQSKQDAADARLVLNAKSEALDMFEQWLQAYNDPTKVWMMKQLGLKEPLVMLIPRPINMFIEQHYPLKSKYTSEDLKKIRLEEFNRLKQEYKERYGNK